MTEAVSGQEIQTPQVEGQAGSPVDVNSLADAITQRLSSSQEISADTITPVSYDQTGDPGLDLALSFVGNLGIGVDHPAMKAAIDGNFDQLKGMFTAMGDKAKGWEQYVAIAEAAVERDAKAAEAAQGELNAAVHAICGGEDEWVKVKKWASANATPAEKTMFNDLLKKGKEEAQFAARTLLGLYQQSAGVTVKPKSAVNPGASSEGRQAPASINNKRDLVREVEALRREVGPNFQQDPRYAQLHQRYENR